VTASADSATDRRSEFEGRVALVTGAGRNIGRAVALAYARAGASVVVAGRDAARLAATRELIVRELELPAASPRVLSRAGDLAQDGNAEALVAFALAQHGRIDCLACFAGGGGADEPLDAHSPGHWEAIVRDNLFTSMRCARAALTPLRATRGTILFCSGGGAWFPEINAHHTAYAVAKAALCRLTDQLAYELLGDGIRVNCIQPGLVWNEHDLARIESEERASGKPHPLRTVNHSSAAVAELALWLSGPHSAPLSGRLVALDDPWWRGATRADLKRVQADPHAYTLRRHMFNVTAE
jgi:3-oxoacyl-[acyl-carrier protein] reductase